MFCKRIQKTFPADTFILKPARIMAILQLCLAFTIIAWHASYPFTGKLYEIKSKLLVYQHVIGIKNKEYSPYFTQLSSEQRTQILHDYEELQRSYDQPFFSKLQQSFRILILEIPATEIVWLLLSILIPIFLLKRVEGSVPAVWLIPIAMACYALDNRWHGHSPLPSSDAHLFPTEKFLVDNYLNQEFSSHILEQQKQLLKAWETYLIYEWANEKPSEVEDLFLKQKNRGDFSFNLARLKFIHLPLPQGQIKSSYYFLSLALFWNLSFAILIWNVLFQKQKNPNASKISC
jgi:hypothetical protein